MVGCMILYLTAYFQLGEFRTCMTKGYQKQQTEAAQKK